VVVSGLARGIDTAAHRSAIENGGRTIAVIGTPLSKASPVDNAPLQEAIWHEHLLISPFPEGRPVHPKNFPERNRVMAALSDATVIIEASDTSGTLHQAAECLKLGRWLFILRTAAENPSVTWPKRFLSAKNTVILDRTEQIFDVLQ
jgi:DNA processing protein